MTHMTIEQGQNSEAVPAGFFEKYAEIVGVNVEEVKRIFNNTSPDQRRDAVDIYIEYVEYLSGAAQR